MHLLLRWHSQSLQPLFPSDHSHYTPSSPSAPTFRKDINDSTLFHRLPLAWKFNNLCLFNQWTIPGQYSRQIWLYLQSQHLERHGLDWMFGNYFLIKVYLNSHRELFIWELPFLQLRRKVKVKRDDFRISCFETCLSGKIAINGTEDGALQIITNPAAYWYHSWFILLPYFIKGIRCMWSLNHWIIGRCVCALICSYRGQK